MTRLSAPALSGIRVRGRQPRSSARSGTSLLAVMIPYLTTVALWASFVRWDLTFALAIALICAFICVRQIVLAVVDPQAGPVALVFWIFIFGWICVGSIVQLSQGVMPWVDSGLEALLAPAQLQFLLAIICYIFGVRVASLRTSRAPYEVPGVNISSPPIMARRLTGLLGLGLALAVPVLASSGGLAGRFQTRQALGVAQSGLGGDTISLFFVNRLPAAIALVAAYAAADAVRRRHEGTRAYVGTQLRLIVALGLVALLANPYSSPRYLSFSVIAALALGLVVLRNPARKAQGAIAMLFATLVIYPLATWFKKLSIQANPQVIDVSTYTGIDFDGYQMAVNTLAYVQESGIAWGSHIVAAIAFFVPRSIWPGKAWPASLDVAAARGYSFQNLSLPLWSEFYLDLGIGGVIIGMFALGYISRHLDHAYALRQGSPTAHLAVVVAVAQIGLIRGPLGASMVFFGTVVLLGAATFRRSRTLVSRDPSPAPGPKKSHAPLAPGVR